MARPVFRPKPCVSCGRTFQPGSGRAKFCHQPDCKPTARAQAPDGQVKPDALLDLLSEVKRAYKHASPEQLRGCVQAYARARAAGQRDGAVRSLIELAAVAVVLADRPERIAMPKPVLAVAR